MPRKLFCELSPAAYRLSLRKQNFRRRCSDFLHHKKFAKEKSQIPLPYAVSRHKSLIRRKLGRVDMRLQENKAKNLALAAPRVCGVLIHPGEEFSFWRLVGECTKRRGYLEGMVIHNGAPGKGVGGGMCQFTNLLHWMVLHSPLEITEHHHHNQVDLFPDFGRQVPFGVGTSIAYAALDYRFRNPTDQVFQILCGVEEPYLFGELRCSRELTEKYHIEAREEHFQREQDGLYRCNEIWRICVDRRTGEKTESLLMKNHAKILYDETFVEKSKIVSEFDNSTETR
ncbi:VanW family protein [Acidaminobacterium chupaoyuni]